MLKRFAFSSIILLLTSAFALAHNGNTHLAGTVTAIDASHITIKGTDGKSVIVLVNNLTKYLQGTKAIDKAEVKPGSRVVIEAKMDTAKKLYAAEEVRLGVATPAKPAAKPGTTKASKTQK
jgi:hypothetical protein